MMFIVDSVMSETLGLLSVLCGVVALFVLFALAVLSVRMQAFCRMADSAICPQQILSSRGKLWHSNAAFVDLFGGDRRSVPVILTERGAESDQQAIAALVKRAKGGQSGQVELRIALNAMGGTQWLKVSVHPLRTWISALAPVVWSVEETTHKRQMQDLLDDQQDRFVDLLEDLPIGFFSVDEDGRFLAVNQALAEWLGYSAEDLKKGTVRLHDLLSEPLPCDIPPWHPFPELTKDTGDLSLSVRGQSGEPEQIDVAISQQVAGERGFKTHSVVCNLTREREMLVALEQSEKRFRAFFDEAPVGIALVDARRRLQECNAAFLRLLTAPAHRVTGTGPNKTDGNSVCAMVSVHGQSGEQGLEGCDLLSLFDESQARVVADIFAGPSGLVDVILNGRTCGLQATALDVGTGLAGGTLLNFVDVTDQRDLEARFAQSQKMQAVGQLAGGIAHDFNNLLTAMIGFADLLLGRHRPGDQSFSDIMQIRQNANRAANLVRQLLAFSRQQALQPRCLNVTETLADTAHLLRRLMGESLTLRIAHGRDLGDILADQGQFEQVIVNLAVNARDALDQGRRQGGQLDIVTANVVVDQPYCYRTDEIPAGYYVLIKVQDNGQGIAPEHIDRIFDPFFSTKEPGGGTGLGLSTVYGIVRQSNGFIFVDSDLGKGTTFTLLFPHYHPDDPSEKPEAPEKVQDLTGMGSVLLVEDEEAVRAFAARALRNKGYDVLEADCGEQALALFAAQKNRVDLVISDVVMPQMDGPTLVQELQARNPALKVIFTSGYTEDSFRKSLSDDDAIEFLPKPFDLKQLARKVKDVLGHNDPEML